MIKRSTACKAMSLFVLSLLCFTWSCKEAESGKNIKYDTTSKDKKINIHLVISDSLGKAYTDTIYRIDLASIDTFRIKQLADCSEPPRKTGGSSPCTIDLEVFEDKDDKDDDDKN
jgi:hypothetical protein